MNGRERIRAACTHSEPDRIPIDLGATTSSGISVIAYKRLIELLGEDRDLPRVFDVVQQLADPSDSVLERFGVDVCNVWRAFTADATMWKRFTMPDGAVVAVPLWFDATVTDAGALELYDRAGNLTGIMPEGATFFDQTHFPYVDTYPSSYGGLGGDMARVHWAACPVAPWDRVGEPEFWQSLRQSILSLRHQTDRALVIQAGGKLVEWGFFLRRMDNFLMDLRSDPVEVERLLDALLERQLNQLARICDAVGDLADIIRFGDDLGMDLGPLMAPATYRRLIKPRHAQLCAMVHGRTRAHTMLHSCGSIYHLIPDLIDAGFEILNPVQISSRSMEPARLKREFGNEVTFWGGGCDTRWVLNRGTPAEVRTHVLENLEVFAPGGGYVFNPVHNILPDVPPENILAMFEAVEVFSLTHYGRGFSDA